MKPSQRNRFPVHIISVLLLVLSMATAASAAGVKPPAYLAWDGFGVMVDLRGGTFFIQGGNVYQFNSSSSSSMLDNSFTGSVDCFDSTGAPCSTTDAPPPPQPDPFWSNLVADLHACTFLTGGMFPATAYVQPLKSGPYSYTYHYSVAPKVDVVAPLTGWNLLQQKGRTGIVVRGTIANEAVTVMNTGAPSYSFPATNLLSTLHLYANGQEVKISTSVVRNCAGCLFGQPGSLDFNFAPNVGGGHAINLLKPGDARTILDSDADPRNDNGGQSGALLEEALLQSVPLQLAPGRYSLMLTGSSANIGFVVGGTVRVLDTNCASQ